MTKEDLVQHVENREQRIWSTGTPKQRIEWDNYAEQLLEDAGYWDNLTFDKLVEAYQFAKEILDQTN